MKNNKTINPMNSSVAYGCHGAIYLINITEADEVVDLIIAIPGELPVNKESVAEYLKMLGREIGYY